MSAGVGWREELLEAAERGGLVVTANERAARTLRRGWDTAQRRQGRERWEPLRAQSWRSWCQAMWRDRVLAGATDRVLLNPAQETRMWAAVVRADGSIPSAGRVDAVAGMCVEAYRRLHSFRGETRLRDARASALRGDSAIFARWMRSFEARCERDRFQPDAGLEAELAREMILGACAGRKIRLVGFDWLTPAQLGFLQAWRAAGGLATEVRTSERHGGAQLFTAEDEAGELRACARWAREHWKSRRARQVAVVAADPDGLREELESVLREVMAPEFEDVLRDASGVPWEFSLGRTLAVEPMVQAALDLLRWVQGPLSPARVTRLLLSPYVAGGREKAEDGARAELDARLRGRTRLQPEISLSEMVRVLQEDSLRRQLPDLVRGVQALGRLDNPESLGRKRFGEWAEVFRGWLRAASWAETTRLGSREFQVRERWEGLLDTLATVDALGEAVELAEALAEVERLAAGTVFAPEARDAAVQVMGPLEAAGSEFDAIWVLRSGEMEWPPRSAPHALLPPALQRELGMPGTSSRRDRENAMVVTRRLAGSAPEVVFSYARVGADGATQNASAMVAQLADTFAGELLDLAAGEEEMQGIVLEELEEGPIAALPEGVGLGGFQVLELQAACGFRAFAEKRLGLRELPAAERLPGMDAMERGSAVHRALEMFWAEMRSHARLMESKGALREETIAQSVDRALERVTRHVRVDWDEAYLRVQRRRIVRLLRDWLLLEEKRPAFTVLHQESARSVRIGPLELKVRVDRTDEVDGSQVLIDYKTGEASPSDWLGDRPNSPQLPLYAVMTRRLAGHAVDESAQGNGPVARVGERPDLPLGGVAFALVHAGKKHSLRGLEDVPGLRLPAAGRQQTDGSGLDEQVARWDDVLTQLATDFAEGDAGVRPKQFPQTCQYCRQRLLCRVEASMFEADGDTWDQEHDESDDVEDGLG